MAKIDFQRLAQDLLHLEINTIISSEISAEKRPDKNRTTFYKLAGDYSKTLTEVCAFNDLKVRTHENVLWPYGGLASYSELKDDARNIENQLVALRNQAQEQEVPDGAYIDKLTRSIRKVELIGDNAANIMALFYAFYYRLDGKDAETAKTDFAFYENSRKAADSETSETKPPHLESIAWNNDIGYEGINVNDDLPLQPQDTARLQKAWDIGTEEIVMQTVISIDGDVTTRIARKFADKPTDFVVKAHQDAIGTSIGFWENLMNAFKSAISSLGNVLSGNK